MYQPEGFQRGVQRALTLAACLQLPFALLPAFFMYPTRLESSEMCKDLDRRANSLRDKNQEDDLLTSHQVLLQRRLLDFERYLGALKDLYWACLLQKLLGIVMFAAMSLVVLVRGSTFAGNQSLKFLVAAMSYFVFDGFVAFPLFICLSVLLQRCCAKRSVWREQGRHVLSIQFIQEDACFKQLDARLGGKAFKPTESSVLGSPIQNRNSVKPAKEQLHSSPDVNPTLLQAPTHTSTATPCAHPSVATAHSARPVYHCELGCGYAGSFDQVTAHEKTSSCRKREGEKINMPQRTAVASGRTKVGVFSVVQTKIAAMIMRKGARAEKPSLGIPPLRQQGTSTRAMLSFLGTLENPETQSLAVKSPTEDPEQMPKSAVADTTRASMIALQEYLAASADKMTTTSGSSREKVTAASISEGPVAKIPSNAAQTSGANTAGAVAVVFCESPPAADYSEADIPVDTDTDMVTPIVADGHAKGKGMGQGMGKGRVSMGRGMGKGRVSMG
jgi:hypothetical protein